MTQPEKIEHIKMEMERYMIGVLAFTEARCKKNGDIRTDGYRLIYSGGSQGQRGVGIIIIIIMIFYCGLMVHITDTRTQKVVSYTSAHITETVLAHDQHWEEHQAFQNNIDSGDSKGRAGWSMPPSVLFLISRLSSFG